MNKIQKYTSGLAFAAVAALTGRQSVLGQRARYLTSAALLCLADVAGTTLGRAQTGPGMALLTTAFTYQGRLTLGTNAANGLYDLRYSLYPTNFGGSPLAGAFTNSGVAVSNGLFTTYLDFGPGAFLGNNLWLEVAVRSNSFASFTTIGPRQQLTPVPYALYAPNAGAASSVSGLQVQQNGTSPNMIGGFGGNSVSGGTVGAVIAGGGTTGLINSVSGWYSTIAGGVGNSALQTYDVIGGGLQNLAQGTEATVAGGADNNAAANASTVGGGTYNTANGIGATIAGGYNNSINLNYGTIGGGAQNFAGGYATVAGGQLNNASGMDSAVAGGSNNVASGYAATIGGGQNNVAAGAYSFAAGQQAQANHQGAFVWADSQNAPYSSTANDQFLIRAAGGVGIGTNNPQGVLHLAATGQGKVLTMDWPDPVPPSTNGPSGGHVEIGGSTAPMVIHQHRSPSLLDYPCADTLFLQIDPNTNCWSSIGFSTGAATDWRIADTASADFFISPAGFGRQYRLFMPQASEQVWLVPNGGNVGIGTQTPQTALDVQGETRTCVLTITGGCDLSEPFRVSSQTVPKGSIVVIDEENPGQLKQSERAYDTRVAGIVSGANGIHPGITLHQQGLNDGGENVALSGRVYALADASNGPIGPGDLLTTSDTRGHCMKVTDHTRAQGSIIGKAMSGLKSGKGMVLVLVSLQ